jgi:hypothetical protein
MDTLHTNISSTSLSFLRPFTNKKFMVVQTEYYTVKKYNEKHPGTPAARCKVAHVHELGIFIFNNLLNQMIKHTQKQN